jgi:hypothetical protein
VANSFFVEYHQVGVALGHMLGMRFGTNRPNAATPVGKDLLAAMANHDAGRFAERDYALYRLAFFARHLHEVQLKRPELFRIFRRRIKKSRSDEEFYGIRFEIKMASTLVRHNVAFKMPEPPDIKVP